MHLKISKRGDRRYLSVVQNYREGGKTKTRTVESIGYADAFADRYPDPIAHFRTYVDELNEAQRASKQPVTLSFARDEQIKAHGEPTAREGAGIVLAYFDALGVGSFFRARERATEGAPQAGRVFEMLAVERAQHVTSKLETWQARASFPRTCDFSFKEVYEALPAIARASAGLVTHMNRALESIRGPRDASVVYLVLQSFSFATANDVDSTRHLHGSGSGRPLVGLGMALDRDGIPITYWIMPATPTPADVRRTVDRLKRDLGAHRVIVVAGRTPHAADIAHDLTRTGDGFVINRPLRPDDEDRRAWIADPAGYRESRSGNYRIKSRITAIQGGSTGDSVKDVVLWGRDYTARARRARSERARYSSEWAALAQETQAAAAPGPHPAAQATPPADLDGYVCVASSEVDLSEAAIFHIYREIWRLAEPFQIMEADVSPSPFPVPHADHVRAHFLICYTSFFALRLLRADMGWSYNAAQVAQALLEMRGAHLRDNWYLFSYRSPVSDAIEEATGVPIARKLRTTGDMRALISTARAHIERAGGRKANA